MAILRAMATLFFLRHTIVDPILLLAFFHEKNMIQYLIMYNYIYIVLVFLIPTPLWIKSPYHHSTPIAIYIYCILL